ncbi:hypothetical protein ACHAXR_009079 [Thalassiosira sp. AJA248-18]
MATTPRTGNGSNIQRREINLPDDGPLEHGQDTNKKSSDIETPAQIRHQPDGQKEEHYLPLSWNESRSRLRRTLEQWNSERKRQRNNDDKNNNETGGRRRSILSVDDPDMIFLTIPLSLLFVVLSFVLPHYGKSINSDRSQHYIESKFYRMEQAAALLFLISSITAAWISRRRRKISRETDRSIERRRCVSAFLKGMKLRRNERMDGQQRQQESSTIQGGPNNLVPIMEEMKRRNPNLFNVDTIPRKNVEDVYSTYRLNNHQNDNDVGQGQWHRIPTLLLVEGDFIALKVGDTAPAKCTVVSTFNDKDASGNVSDIIEAGERLTVIEALSPLARDTLALSNMSNSTTSVASIASAGTIPTSNATKNNAPKKRGILPPGRSALKYHSEEMLLLANGVQIFVLLETPLDSFLRKEDAKKQYVSPQVLRQGEAIRIALLQFAVVAFLITLFILLVRPGKANTFFQSPTWSLPLLSALGVLPVMTPLFLFWVECIGTSRILAAVHPLASNQKQRMEPKGISESCRQNSILSLDDHSSSENGGMEKPPPWLLCRYLIATASSRLFTKSLLKKISSRTHRSSSKSFSSTDALLSIPPASLHLLEKLGVVTALALVDDELACEPFSTPQQLLIPSGQGGLKLLDICPVFDGDAYSTGDEDNENTNMRGSSRPNSDLISIDSDDSNEETRFNHSFSVPVRTIRKIRRNYRKKKYVSGGRRQRGAQEGSFHQYGVIRGDEDDDDVEMQFEDPNWWQYLPSLKCIGLGCLLVEDRIKSKTEHISQTPSESGHTIPPNPSKVSFDIAKSSRPNGNGGKSCSMTPVETSLIDHICCDERERKQLQLLAQCIGFDTSPGAHGSRGDLSSFQERRRLHILSTNLLGQRMKLDSHALGLEESRNWSRLFTDADTVFVRDKRSGGDLVLTVGDARVVTQLCPDWWQGENSTISPLTAADRNIINETQKNWMLSDLDVQAFSYAPLPYTADQKIEFGGAKGEHIFLLDNAAPNASIPSHGFWSLVKNQIFLGLLGSSVRPRREIEPLIDSCADAGVRFVYFSPRNMRRTKELGSQMGIDVAWNCAISLRPLEEGTDDSFRMTSNYADWDVNARLPHGVDDVRRHLEEVDNVPLLVSLYTDATKKTAADMVNVFQEYNDTVLSVGLSHLPGNQDIFSRADIAIGVDVLAEDVTFNDDTLGNPEWNALQADEVAFVTSISAHSSVFNLWGSRANRHFVEIIRIGRACLEAATSCVSFVLSGCLSFSIFILLCPCTAATAVPTISALDAFVYTQILLPLIGLSMASADEAKDFMTRVPPKNDPSGKYSLRANSRLYLSALLRSALPAIIPQFIYLIALGDLLWHFDSPFVEEHCLQSPIIRCQALRDYSGPARESAGTISLAALALCTCVSSASYVFRTEAIRSEPPWKRNHLWLGTLSLSFLLIAVYMALVLEKGSMAALSWYFYILFLVAPFVCLYFCEVIKKIDQRHEKRAVMMRRLQFETRLGMWSPKESTHPEHMNDYRRENDSPIV